MDVLAIHCNIFKFRLRAAELQAMRLADFTLAALSFRFVLCLSM